MIPSWVSWRGLGEHLLVGTALAALCWRAGAQPWLAVVLSLALGLWHEWQDGDFTTEQGVPWNGLLDVGAFVLGPLIWWLLAIW